MEAVTLDAVKNFVTAALEASIYVAPRDHGLTVAELVQLGSLLGLHEGEIHDAARADHRGMDTRGGRLCLNQDGVTHLADFLFEADPDPRNWRAFEFIHVHLRELARRVQQENARVDRSVLVAHGEAEGYSKHDLDVALTLMFLTGQLDERGGALGYIRGRETYALPSVFDRKRPLAEKTLWRVAQGIRRYVLETSRPFIVKVNHGGFDPRGESLDEPLYTVTATQRGHAVVAPTLVQTGYGERDGQRPRALDLHAPLGTLVNGQKHALVSAFLAKHFGDPTRSDGGGGVVLGSELSDPIGTITARDHHSLAAVALAKFRGSEAQGHPGCASVGEPMPTITAKGWHVAEVRAFLTAYYGSDASGGQMVTEPMRTLTARHRLGLVTVSGVDYQIVDIGLRMLEPHELLRAQFGRFAADYDLSAATTKKDQIRLIGNSVCPEIVEALVRANVGAAERRAA